MKEQHPLIQKYVDDVCRQVKAKQLREDIRQEISSHLEELMELKRSQGADDQTAATWAIDQMGDPSSVARGFNQVHRPRFPWGVFGLLALLLIIAVSAMHAVELGYRTSGHVMADAGLFKKQAVFIMIGIVMLLLLSRIHYRKLLPFSWLIYAGAVVLLLAGTAAGMHVNGVSGYIDAGPVTIRTADASLFLFVIALAGFLCRRQESWKAAAIHALLFAVVPIVLYAMIASFSTMALYAAVLVIICVLAGCSWRWMLPHLLLFLCFFAFYPLVSLHARTRLTAFLHRYNDPDGAGYLYVQIDEAMRSAGWLGQGFDSIQERLPYVHADMIFTYLVHGLGWLAGAAILFIVIVFVTQLAKAMGAVKESYGKLLIAGIGTLFAVQFAWNIGMSAGFLPLAPVSLPLISYGGSGMVMQLAAMGIIFSVYRQKDMVRAG